MTAFIQTSAVSPWLKRMDAWTLYPPEYLSVYAQYVWLTGCRMMIELVESGYSTKFNQWWSWREIGVDRAEDAMFCMVLMLNWVFMAIQVEPDFQEDYVRLARIIGGPNWQARFLDLTSVVREGPVWQQFIETGGFKL